MGEIIELKPKEQESRWIAMSNALTKAGHGLSLAEKRVVILAASKLDSRRQLKPGEVPRTKITAAEYAEAFELDPDTAYNQLQSSAKSLYSRSITFYEDAKRRARTQRPKKTTVVTMRWVGEARYHQGEGWVELAWWTPLLPHLIGLKKSFTTYQLQQTRALRSVYSWRLLELLQRFESTGWAEYDVEDFATSMDATKTHRANFAKLRTQIIEPAVKELSEKDGWLITWHPKKRGRKVVAIRFDFMRDPQGRLEL